MQRLVVGLIAVAASLSLTTSAMAAGSEKVIQEGPYGPKTFKDVGTCGIPWADIDVTSTYDVNTRGDGHNVNLVLRGTFSTIEGHAPGACGNTDNGNLITSGITGHLRLTVPLTIIGGTFDPAGTCDISCATDYSYAGIRNFAHAFYGPDANNFEFAGPIRETAGSSAHELCANSWRLVQDLSAGTFLSSVGDIASTCPPLVRRV